MVPIKSYVLFAILTGVVVSIATIMLIYVNPWVGYGIMGAWTLLWLPVMLREICVWYNQ